MEKVRSENISQADVECHARRQVRQLIRLSALLYRLGTDGLTRCDAADLEELAHVLKDTIAGYDNLLSASQEDR